MNLSQHLSVKEFTASPTAIRYNISNEMNEEQLNNAKNLAEKVFEPLRQHRGSAIRVTSGYRSTELNKKVGGSKSSQHCKGEAMDLPITNDEAKWIMDNLEFDQLIFEFPDKSGDASWIHVSYTIHSKNRRQVLIAVKIEGRTVYKPFKGNETLIRFIT